MAITVEDPEETEIIGFTPLTKDLTLNVWFSENRRPAPGGHSSSCHDPHGSPRGPAEALLCLARRFGNFQQRTLEGFEGSKFKLNQFRFKMIQITLKI